MLLQQKSTQMSNNLAEQPVYIINKAKTIQQTQEQLSSPLSQDIRTYDFGNLENHEQNSEIILIYHRLHFDLYHVCRNLHKRGSLLLWNYVPLVHSENDPSTSERDLPLQMGALW